MLSYIIIFTFTLFSISYCKDPDIVEKLKGQFNHTSKVCLHHIGNDHAAYKCSGIIIRGVKGSTTHHAWGIKPEKKSFSTAFLRVDTPFSRFPYAYTSGFIIYPPWDTPTNKTRITALCSFPIDGDTDDRDWCGCGRMNNDTIGTSIQCHRQGITSFDEWMALYFKIRKDNLKFPERQCALDMTLPDAAMNFILFLQANHFIRTNKDPKEAGYAYRNNEILFRAWDQNNPRMLPIQAFFHILNNDTALAHAKAYQKDYFENTGEMVPVVGIRLPDESNSTIGIQLANLNSGRQ